MKGILAALCLLVAAPAVAEDYGVIKPPPEWEWRPLRHQVLLRNVHYTEIWRLCPQFAPQKGEHFNACAVLDGGMCYIFIRDDGIHEDMYAALVRHEMAHCRGWPADHPQ